MKEENSNVQVQADQNDETYSTLDESICETFVLFPNIEKRYNENCPKIRICTPSKTNSSEKERITKLGFMGSFNIHITPILVGLINIVLLHFHQIIKIKNVLYLL